MKLIPILCAIVLIVAYADGSNAQQTGPSFTKSTSDVADSTQAIPDAATEAQIREYLRVSGEVQKFRDSWIAAVDKNRSIGAPYWPESFWQAVKDEMQKTDLVPMYVTLFQHGISRNLMQQVLDAYRVRGADHFQGSEECFKLGTAAAAAPAASFLWSIRNVLLSNGRVGGHTPGAHPNAFSCELRSLCLWFQHVDMVVVRQPVLRALLHARPHAGGIGSHM